MSEFLLGASLVAYFIASALYLANLHLKHKQLAAYGTVAAIAGFSLQTLRLILQTLNQSTPFANASEAIFFLSWAIAGLYLAILAWYRLPSVGSLAMPLAVVALALVYRFPTPAGGPLAGDGWMRIHVVAIITSFALFTLAFCCAVFYLIQNKLLKSKRMTGMFRRLPPLKTIDSLGYHLASIGFPLLTLGIITGIVGVEMARMRDTGAEIKLVTSAITWIAYAAYLVAHSRLGWRGKKANWILIVGALLTALTTALHKFS